jgi:hypothetical protein
MLRALKSAPKTFWPCLLKMAITGQLDNNVPSSNLNTGEFGSDENLDNAFSFFRTLTGQCLRFSISNNSINSPFSHFDFETFTCKIAMLYVIFYDFLA